MNTNPNLYFETPFYKHYQAVTKEEYEMARELAKRIARLKAMRSRLLAEKKIDPAWTLPSDMWQRTVDFFCSYCNDPSYEIVNTWRLHTFPFRGRYPGDWIEIEARSMPTELIARYMHHTWGMPDELIVRPPTKMAELGWRYNEGTVNLDTLTDQHYLKHWYYAGLIGYLKRKPIRILEIGGGYGGIAYALDQMLHPISYTMCDLVESLLFASIYIGIGKGAINPDSVYDGTKDLQPEGFSFVPNFLLEDLVGKVKYDLIINTGSLTEMTVAQADKYAELISKLMADGGVFFESNGQPIGNPHPAAIAKRFKHIDLLGNQRFWYKDDSVPAALDAMKPPAPRSKARLVQRIISTLGVKKSLSRGMFKEWTKVVRDRY